MEDILIILLSELSFNLLGTKFIIKANEGLVQFVNYSLHTKIPFGTRFFFLFLQKKKKMKERKKEQKQKLKIV